MVEDSCKHRHQTLALIGRNILRKGNKHHSSRHSPKELPNSKPDPSRNQPPRQRLQEASAGSYSSRGIAALNTLGTWLQLDQAKDLTKVLTAWMWPRGSWSRMRRHTPRGSGLSEPSITNAYLIPPRRRSSSLYSSQARN